jgi:hypothetical protein
LRFWSLFFSAVVEEHQDEHQEVQRRHILVRPRLRPHSGIGNSPQRPLPPTIEGTNEITTISPALQVSDISFGDYFACPETTPKLLAVVYRFHFI